MYSIEKLREGVNGKYSVFNDGLFQGLWIGEKAVIQELVDARNDIELANDLKSNKPMPVSAVTEMLLGAVGKPMLFDEPEKVLPLVETFSNPLAVEPERCETTKEEL